MPQATRETIAKKLQRQKSSHYEAFENIINSRPNDAEERLIQTPSVQLESGKEAFPVTNGLLLDKNSFPRAIHEALSDDEWKDFSREFWEVRSQSNSQMVEAMIKELTVTP